MIKKASFSGLMAALGAVSALAQSSATVEECARWREQAMRYRQKGFNVQAEAAERLISSFCVCRSDDLMLS